MPAPLLKRKATNPELSYKLPRISVVKVKPTEEEKEAERERIKKILAKRAHKGHVHKNISRTVEKKRIQNERRAKRRKKRKMRR